MKVDLNRNNYRETIITGTPELDQSLNGGLGKGEVGFIIGPVSVGKSALSAGLGTTAACIGKGVVHFSIDEYHVETRYLGNFLDMDRRYIFMPEVLPYVKELIYQFEPILELVDVHYYTPNKLTVEEIEKNISEYDGTPELVIIDGLSVMKDAETTESMTHIIYDIKGIARKYNVAVWMTFQLAGEYKDFNKCPQFILNNADVVISMAQTYEQVQQCRLNASILKNRYCGRSRVNFLNVKFNGGTGKFDMSDIDEDELVLNDTQSKQLRLAKQLREPRKTEKTSDETCNEEKQAMDIKEAENKVINLIRNNPKNAL